MILNINDDKPLENPSAETMRFALAELSVDEFAVLSSAEEMYVQTYQAAYANLKQTAVLPAVFLTEYETVAILRRR